MYQGDVKMETKKKGKDAKSKKVVDNVYRSHYTQSELGLYFFFQNYKNCKEDLYHGMLRC